MQIVNKKGKLQKINVMVCTYNEPADTVEECVRHLLKSPVPIYASKHIYIGDDGAKGMRAERAKGEKGDLEKFQCSDDKKKMVDQLNAGAHQILCDGWKVARLALKMRVVHSSAVLAFMVASTSHDNHVQLLHACIKVDTSS